MSHNRDIFNTHSQGEQAPFCLRRCPIVILCCFLVLMATYRLTLIRSGHFFWGDEIRYLRAGEVLHDASRGDYQSAAGRLFQSLGRPGFILISIIPTWAGRVAQSDAAAETTPLEFYDAAAVFNVVVSLAVTALMYAVARTWRMTAGYALLAAMAFSLLAQSNVWIRHLVPYNESLLLFLFALWLISRKQGTDIRTLSWIVLAGCLSAVAFATYPGHYLFVVINLFLAGSFIACREADSNIENKQAGYILVTQRAKRAAAFCCGAILIVIMFEGLAQYAGTTWVGSSSQFAPTMGLFSEGYAFAWHYLRDGEGLIGIVLSVLLIIYFARTIIHRKMTASSVAILAAAVCYLIHATLGVVLHKTVFYGRILMMYMPFVVIGAVMAVAGIRSMRLRRVATFVLVVASCWSFAQFAIGYAKLNYPADFWYGAVAHSARDAAALTPDEFYGSVDGSPFGITDRSGSSIAMVADSTPEGSAAYIPLASHENAQRGDADLIGVNVRWMFYIRERDERFTPPPSHRLMAEANHPLAFPPLQFEGFRPCERTRMQERQYTMRIYQKNESAAKAGDALADVSR